ncbi:SDH family Clp fold serine proteinase [Parvularcula maris]|uniref:SppA protein n=1 Tax=Parvularcula maris TaxID=2965077 RepID=A0A9X2L9N7_9PROT|nr:hypothetical protein [Parvularcula maris]MCQ8185650.1 hypothetical protein [Parvularcula maris]
MRNNIDVQIDPSTIEKVQDRFDADLILFSGSIDNTAFGKIASAVGETRMVSQRNSVVFSLTTNGGQANAAFQISRLLQETYDEVVLLIPSYCKSAGTLIALGASKLIMDSFSELGPLDVQLVKENEIAGRKSGLISKAAFESLHDATFEAFQDFMLRTTVSSYGNINFKLASEIATNLSTGVMAGIYSQINPETLGSDYRDLNVAIAYGSRLADYSQNAMPMAVHRLVHEYPSHDFIIDVREARTLFNNVADPSDELYEIYAAFAEILYNEAADPFCMSLTKSLHDAEEGGLDHDEEPDTEAKVKASGSLDDSGFPDRSGDSESSGYSNSGSNPSDGETAKTSTAHSDPATELHDKETLK